MEVVKYRHEGIQNTLRLIKLIFGAGPNHLMDELEKDLSTRIWVYTLQDLRERFLSWPVGLRPPIAHPNVIFSRNKSAKKQSSVI